MEKFGLHADYAREQGLLTQANGFRPAPCRQAWLTRTHCRIARFAGDQLSAREKRQMNLPWSKGLVRRTFLALPARF